MGIRLQVFLLIVRSTCGLFVLTVLVGCSETTKTSTLQDLPAPKAAVVKLVGDMKFTEGPIWLPKEKKLIFSELTRGELLE